MFGTNKKIEGLQNRISETEINLKNKVDSVDAKTEILPTLTEKINSISNQIEKTNERVDNQIIALSNIYKESKELKSLSLNQNFTPEQIKQAAYALNLCTVSVSQIIDYSDLNILEQEYEAILNNLNLENFPKDDELRTVLEKILDTITFFRIQEIKKTQLEKKYQHKMKNAIWSAVPNIGLIVAGGHPVTMAISLATQVGCGYMNYRKEKANIGIEKEDEEIQMQISAIEQFNALRRELFTTAWKLAETYKFPDEYRLSEKQIDLYNKILMDSDFVRKYQRLVDIRKYFIAYPPFYYYLGNTANIIAQEKLCRIKEIDKLLKEKLKENSDIDDETFDKLINEKNICQDVFEHYQQIAIENFKTFFYENGDFENENELKFSEKNRYSLLREDLIAASCALEYTELLDEQKEEDRIVIKGLLEIAEKYAPNEFDILQLCAMESIRIGEFDEAKKLLQKLVNEDYNKIVNVQILSRILSQEIITNDENKSDKAKQNYYFLETRINPIFLFPLPKSKEDYENGKKQFLDRQTAILVKKASYVFSEFRLRYMKAFNQLIPVPYPEKYYPDEYFCDSKDAIQTRIIRTKSFLEKDNKNAHNYLDSLKNFSFGLRIIELFERMTENLAELSELNPDDDGNVSFFTDAEIDEFCNEIKRNLKKEQDNIKNCEDYFSNLDVEETLVTNKDKEKAKKDSENVFDFNQIDSLFNITFSNLTNSAFEKLVEFLSNFYDDNKDYDVLHNPMKELSQIDEQFNSWAQKQSIPVSNEEFYLNDMPKQSGSEEKYFDYEDLGGDYQEKEETANKIKNIIKRLDDSKIIKNHKKYKFLRKYSENENEQDINFSRILQKELGKKNEIDSKKRQKIFAILDDVRPVVDTDLLFATNGIYVKNMLGLHFASYSEVDWEDAKRTKLRIGNSNFSNIKDLNMNALMDFIRTTKDDADNELDDSFKLYLDEGKSTKILNSVNQAKTKLLDSANLLKSLL